MEKTYFVGFFFKLNTIKEKTLNPQYRSKLKQYVLNQRKRTLSNFKDCSLHSWTEMGLLLLISGVPELEL